MSVSVIIPARNEKYLAQTIQSTIAAAKGDYEIIAVCDGYWPDPAIQDHPKVNVLHFTEAIGQRAATNAAAKVATKKYIMKIDGHTIMDEGFDLKLEKDIEGHPDWTICPLMYGLDVGNWKPRLEKRPTEFMYIGNWDGRKIRIQYWHDYRKRPESKGQIVDLMVGMGNCFFLEWERFLDLGGLDENHGSWGQVGIEVACKSWLSGGRHVLSRNTWFSHWFRKDVGFPYPLSGKQVEEARAYSIDLWTNNKWPKQKRTFQWLINKFAPIPSWDGESVKQDGEFDERWAEKFHAHLIQEPDHHPKWEGIIVRKWPEDLANYAEVIFETKPDVIVETGTWKGGGTLYFARLLDVIGKGEVISVDVLKGPFPQHPRITYINGSSKDDAVVTQIKQKTAGKTCMVVLDAVHNRYYVKWELVKYEPIVTPGQYLVVEDAFTPMQRLRLHHQPLEAVEWFMKTKQGKSLERTDREKRFLISGHVWLRKKV